MILFGVEVSNMMMMALKGYELNWLSSESVSETEIYRGRWSSDDVRAGASSRVAQIADIVQQTCEFPWMNSQVLQVIAS
jgi:hypothetical protein